MKQRAYSLDTSLLCYSILIQTAHSIYDISIPSLEHLSSILGTNSAHPWADWDIPIIRTSKATLTRWTQKVCWGLSNSPHRVFLQLQLQVEESQFAAHSCFVEKYRMRAVQWENDFNTFLQTLVNISWFFYSPAMWGYVGGTWWSPSKYWGWLLVVLAQLVRFILKCC